MGHICVAAMRTSHIACFCTDDRHDSPVQAARSASIKFFQSGENLCRWRNAAPALGRGRTQFALLLVLLVELPADRAAWELDVVDVDVVLLGVLDDVAY
jgi:hypothetical protein